MSIGSGIVRAISNRGAAAWLPLTPWVIVVVAGLWIPGRPDSARAFAPEEQEMVLEEVLASLAREWGGDFDPASQRLVFVTGEGTRVSLEFEEPGFGATAAASVNDADAGRYHPYGSTLFSELTQVSRERLQRFLEDEKGKAPGGNVSARYLAHHWRALRLARGVHDAGPSPPEAMLGEALFEEALALSHLMDAFSASHFFHPGPDFLDWLHRTNNRERHERARFMGAYVMDSRGDVWQSFGDGLLRWNPATRERVTAAVRASLSEFFAVYFGDAAPNALTEWRDAHSPREDASAWVDSWLEPADGVEFYEAHRLPSLMRVPMAITATWSERDSSRVEHGIAARRHWPQLREPGAHDPVLNPDLVKALPSAEQMPGWLRFPRLELSSPQTLLLQDPELASVRFTQERRVPPTFKGGLLLLGAGPNLRGDDSAWLLSGGVGWGFVDKLLPLRQLLTSQRLSVELRGHWDPDAADAYGVLALATQLDSSGLPGALHLELGVADGWQGRYTNWGVHLGIGLATYSFKLSGVYLGGMARLRYSVGYMGEAVHSVLLDLLVH